MGIKIHGECGGCRRQSDLVVDEMFCSQACKQRNRDAGQWMIGFGTGIFATVGFIVFVFAVWWCHAHTLSVEWKTKAQTLERQ